MGNMNRFDRDRFDAMGKEAMSRVEEIMNSTRLNELLHRKEEEDKKKNCIGAVAAVAGIAALVYKYLSPDYLEDIDDDYDDDFDDDFFEDEAVEEKKASKEEE